VCTGKLTLFPAIIIFLGFGAGYLLLYGNKTYDGGYFESDEIYYGIAGAILLLLAVSLLLSLVVWLVLRVSFIITPTQLKVVKSGLLRSSTLEFDISCASLHYFRTHFIEGRSWLQLVVREHDQFYQVFSWKGEGKQKERFTRLFGSLNSLVKAEQKKFNTKKPSKRNSEIISTKERNLIGPFNDRLKRLTGTSSALFQDRNAHLSGDDIEEQPLCIEDIHVVSFDSFFDHFKNNKKLEERVRPPM